MAAQAAPCAAKTVGILVEGVTKRVIVRDLSPVDIVVRRDGVALHRVGEELLPHRQAHTRDRNTVVRISISQQESVLWQSEQRFTITNIASVSGDSTNPFFRALPMKSSPSLKEQPTVYRVNSGPPQPDTAGQYKISLDIGGQHVDPDLDIGI